MITYSKDKNQKAEHIANVFINSGIRRPASDLNRIQKMIDNCDILITAWDEEQMVGVCRAITDYSYCCYLSDLAVDKEYHQQGIGSELVNQLQDEVGVECSIVLISAPTATEYYPKIGFEKTDKAFLIARRK